MHRRLISIASSALAAAVVAGVLVAGSGASAAPATKPAAAGKAKAAGPAFRQVLAAKLGAQLDQPAADVLAALKSAGKATRPDAATRRAHRAERAKGTKPSKTERTQRRSAAKARKQAFSASVAKTLGVEPAAVDRAVAALVRERLDSLVEDGWLTAAQRDRRLAKGGLGLAFLRTGVR